MQSFVTFGALLLITMAAHANDSAFEGVGGTIQPTRGENEAIRMVREKVVLSARKKDYATRAEFVFSNETGRAQNVAMGFPEGNFGDVAPSKTGFRGFKTFVDGRSIAAKRVKLKEMDDNGFDAYWVKTVPFAPHQTRRVLVEFSSPYGGTVNWGMTRALSYSFTGKNWRDKVDESVLEVRVSEPGLWRAVAWSDGGKPLTFGVQTSPQTCVFRHVWKNWEAHQRVTFGLERVTPFWREDTTGDDDGSINGGLVEVAHTVRVGPKPSYLEAGQGFPAQGFTYHGAFYVGVNHLENKLQDWGARQKPNIEPQLNSSPAKGFDLRAGTTRIQGREGSKTLRVNGQSLALGVPIVGLTDGGVRSLYVPLAPVARALGWKVTMKGERLFTLERGNWKG